MRSGRAIPKRRPLDIFVAKQDRTTCVGIYGVSTHLAAGDGYVVLAGEKVLMTEAQLMELFGRKV